MVTAGIKGGYLANPRLREVHWQAGTGRCPSRGQRRRGIGAVGRPRRDPGRRDIGKLGQAGPHV